MCVELSAKICFNFSVFRAKRGVITGKVKLLWGKFISECIRKFILVFHRPDIINFEKADIGEAVIYVSNHIDYRDGQFVLTALGKKLWPRTLAAKEWCDKFLLSPVMTAVGCIPIDRNSGDIGWLRECRRCASSGRSLLIFPEGTTTHEDTVQDFKAGFILVARTCNLKIIPVWHGPCRMFRRTPVVIGDAYSLSHDLAMTAEGFEKECERFREIVSGLASEYIPYKERKRNGKNHN